MKRISNEVLLEKLNNINEKIESINNHLKMLNGQTTKNTNHRQRQGVKNKILGCLGGGAFGIVTTVVTFLIVTNLGG